MHAIWTRFILVSWLTLASASASAAIYTDTFNPTPDIFLTGLINPLGQDSVSWTFDITSDGYLPGTSDPIQSASIAMSLRDDTDTIWWSPIFEFATILVDNDFTAFWEVDTGTTSIQVESVITLTQTGTLDVTLIALVGDFYFEDATLTADTTVVPVPAAVWLFGSGLVGLAGVARRKKA